MTAGDILEKGDSRLLVCEVSGGVVRVRYVAFNYRPAPVGTRVIREWFAPADLLAAGWREVVFADPTREIPPCMDV